MSPSLAEAAPVNVNPKNKPGNHADFSAFRLQTPVLILFVFFLLPLWVGAQKIEILNAGSLSLDTANNQPARKLVGNVKMRQNDFTLECDSALFYIHVNAVDAFGNVVIYDKQTRAQADSLKYNGEEKIAILSGSVSVTQDSIRLLTQTLYYYITSGVGAYYSGGQVILSNMTVSSKKGYYDSRSGDAWFSGDVHVTGSDYTITADSLRYQVKSKVTRFCSPTRITRKDETIICHSGYHESVSGIAVFGKETTLLRPQQKLYADSLLYYSEIGYGQAWIYFEWTDSASDAVLSGKRAEFFRLQNRLVATDSVLLTFILSDDSLFLSADTLLSVDDTVSGSSSLLAFHRVRIYKDNLQGLCDSLVFTSSDSTIRMFNNPVLWSQDNQLTGDTIIIVLHNRQVDRLELFENGFIINHAHTQLFNQIKGRHVYGYFSGGKLHHLLVDGNAESVYFGKDESGGFIGMNKAFCSRMKIYLNKEQVSRIVFLTKPEAVFYPMQLVQPQEHLLKGFSWRAASRPRSIGDLFSNQM
ncbi:MAG: hypothetical protein KatS3mg031_1825 [Chitinophagales bacterium]|nr:MAG: hypothetical protein KatS3mg031_1825 [Chitinophagales bacterium]